MKFPLPKLLPFGITGIILVLMITATILEKIYGTEFVTRHIYHSPIFIMLWGATGISGIFYILFWKMQHHPVTLSIHLALALILIGALTSFLTGKQGNIHLRTDGKAMQEFISEKGTAETLPFHITLDDFHIGYYPGTTAPMDYISDVTVTDGNIRQKGTVSMNHVYKYRHYRFYQSAYDPDSKGSILSVSYDPYGIGITYAGYALLGWSLILYFLVPHSRFRSLLHHPLLQKGSLTCLLALGSLNLQAVSGPTGVTPQTVPLEVAETFGDLYVYYNDRICPLQTLARDFTTKLYGKPGYKGLTAEQVLLGWLFNYDRWKTEPLIRIKGEAANVLGIKGKYASLTDFVDGRGLKLEQPLQQEQRLNTRRSLEEANEKFNLISMAATGSLFRIYPSREKGNRQPVWYSINDKLPADISSGKWLFIRRSMDLTAEEIAHGRYGKAVEIIRKIKEYQQNEAVGILPSDTRFKAEKFYNRLNHTDVAAIICTIIGILSFIWTGRRMSRHSCTSASDRTLRNILLTLLAAICLYLCLTIGLRGYVSGHIPLSNGYETMQFMALFSVIITFIFQHKFRLLLSFGYLICGLSLLVSMFGESNPPVTHLMPVLQSPLLSIHVMFILISYSLLAFMMMNGVMAEILHHARPSDYITVERLCLVSRLLVYPAVACLTAGIFIGAVWANVSWGRYWGWDPKEVWALITLLVYAAALHTDSLSAFRQPMFFHRFTILAFLCVLITYFGVNFFMGGMHSYA